MDPPHDLARDVASTVGKITVGAGPTVYGILTLNNIAVLVGILSSLAVLAHTLLKMWWGYQDRTSARRRVSDDA